MMRPTVAVALLAMLARVAPAQDTLALLPGDREASAELAKIVAATRNAGLPVEPILAKVRYGVVVGHAPPQRIVAAVRLIAARLGASREALAPQPTALDITAGADALGCGATSDALRSVRGASPSRSVVIPLSVLAQLLTDSVPLKRATQIVTDLIKRGASADQLIALGNNVTFDVQHGSQAVAAVDTRLRGLTAVLAAPGAASAADAVAPGLSSAGGPPRKP